MTVKDLLKQHQAAQTAQSIDIDAVDDQGSYGIVRAALERAIMVELRKRDGTVLAIPYALIEQIRYSPDDGIAIHACGRELRIIGQRLNSGGSPSPRVSLFNGLCRHRVAWVSEAAHAAPTAGDDGSATVDEIRW